MKPTDDVVAVAHRILVEEARVPVDAARISEARDHGGDRWATIAEMARRANDPHTMLLSPAVGLRMQIMAVGGPVAMPGFSVHRAGPRIVVNDVSPGSAAESAGLRAGDVLVTLDGVPVRRGMEELLLLSGAAEGYRITLGIVRSGAEMALALEVVPWLPPLLASRSVEAGVGYVRLRAVSTSPKPERDSAALLRSAIRELGGASLSGLVLDLRSNPGGYGVSSVASVLSDRTPLCRYRDLAGTEELVQRKPEPPACSCPVVVLVDDQTLSAAEMITLALQDHGVARVVGVPTAGGLTVPRYVPLADDWLLMAPDRFALGPRTGHRSSDLRIHPDVTVDSRDPEDFAAGRDAQLDRAVELLRTP